MLKIYIDPGHGTIDAYGKLDPGAVAASGLQESDVALSVAQLVSDGLDGLCETKLCRTGTTDKGIDARVKEANAWPADFVLSLHCNAFKEQTAYGAEALIYARGGKAERYAKVILDTLCDKCGLYNRGVKVRTDIGILRNTKVPAVLIEIAFMSNPSEAVRLASNTQCAFIATSICSGIIDALQLNVASDTAISTETTYQKLDAIHHVTIPPANFKVIKWGKGKRTSTLKNYACAPFQASGTVPVGNIVASGVWLARNPNLTTIWVTDDNVIGYGKTPPTNVRHALSGIPLVADGKKYTLAYGLAEGWDTSPFYPTTHAIFGIGHDGNFHYYVFNTFKSGAAASYAEILKIAVSLNLKYAVLVDGGGSTILDIDGTNMIASDGNRQLATLIAF